MEKENENIRKAQKQDYDKQLKEMEAKANAYIRNQEHTQQISQSQQKEMYEAKLQELTSKLNEQYSRMSELPNFVVNTQSSIQEAILEIKNIDAQLKELSAKPTGSVTYNCYSTIIQRQINIAQMNNWQPHFRPTTPGNPQTEEDLHQTFQRAIHNQRRLYQLTHEKATQENEGLQLALTDLRTQAANPHQFIANNVVPIRRTHSETTNSGQNDQENPSKKAKDTTYPVALPQSMEVDVITQGDNSTFPIQVFSQMEEGDELHIDID